MNRSITMKRVGVFATCVVSLAIVGMSCGTANAILAQWTFETSIPLTAGPHTAESGGYAAVSQATGSHAGGATVYSSPAGNGSSHSFSSNTWAIGDYYQFKTVTLNHHDVRISWDETSSGTGPRDFKVQYSTDGSSFFDIFVAPTYTVLPNASPNPVWNATTSSPIYSYTRDLSGITALNNQANIYLRLIDRSTVSANGGTVATSGTDRVDNFTIRAYPLPSAVFIYFGVAGFAGVARRRFKALLT